MNLLQVVVEWWVVPDTIMNIWCYISVVHLVADECLLACYEELRSPGGSTFFFFAKLCKNAMCLSQ